MDNIGLFGRKTHRWIRATERHRQFKIRKSLMRNQGLSQAAAKEIAAGYVYRRGKP